MNRNVRQRILVLAATLVVSIASAAQQHHAASASEGSFSTFDIPGAALIGVCCIDARSDVAGIYSDPSNRIHSFVRARDGTITTVDPPGAIVSLTSGMNPEGAITGSFAVSFGFIHL